MDNVIFEDNKSFVNTVCFNETLKDKVPNDICEDMKNQVVNRIKYKQLELSLLSNCESIECYEKNKLFKAMGYGDIESGVMVLNEHPNEFEVATNTSMNSPDNFFLLYILNYCGIKYYCTDFVKCFTDNANVCAACINNYLLKEIEIVKPKLIICNGIEVLNLLKKYNIIDLNKNLCYGEICSTNICNGINTNVIALYNSAMVLNKTGKDYERCKNELWTQARIVKKFLEE